MIRATRMTAFVLAMSLAAPARADDPAKAAPKVTAQTPPATSGTILYITGGAALAGFLVGGLGGIFALDDKSTVNAHCVGTVCDAQGKNAADSMKTWGTVSTVGFIVGGAALVATVVLALVQKSPDKAASVRASAHGLSVSF